MHLLSKSFKNSLICVIWQAFIYFEECNFPYAYLANPDVLKKSGNLAAAAEKHCATEQSDNKAATHEHYTEETSVVDDNCECLMQPNSYHSSALERAVLLCITVSP